MENNNKQLMKFSYKLFVDLDGNILATLLCQDIIYWSNLNAKNERNDVLYGGIYGTVISCQHLLENLRLNNTYTLRQVQTAMKKLYDKEYIIARRRYNSSSWYAPTPKLREFLGEQEYINITRFSNEGYNFNYDKNGSITNKDFTFTPNTTENQEQISSQPEKPLEATYDTTVPKGYIRNPDGSIRRKIATDPIDNSDFTFVESFAEIMNKR